MKKVMVLVLLAAVSSFSILPFTYFWNIRLSGDTATVAKWRANNDSVLYWSGRISDTVNKAMFRKAWTRDSTFDSMKITKLKHTDSIYSRAARFSVIDSVYTLHGIKAPSGTFTSIAAADSVFGRAIHGTTGYFNKVYDSSILTGTKVFGYSGFTSYQRDTIAYVYRTIPDTIIELYFNGISGTSNGYTIQSDSTLPSFLRPHKAVNCVLTVSDSSYTNIPGMATISTYGGIIFAPILITNARITYTNTFLNSLTKGYDKFSVRYRK
jgi:hypothetical protein